MREQLEDVRKHVGRDADALVADDDDGGVAVAFEANVNLGAGIAVFRGVVDQVSQHLHQPRIVTVDDQAGVAFVHDHALGPLGNHGPG